MTKIEIKGNEIRKTAKKIVIEFMESAYECFPGNEGMKQSVIFRSCGFDWGNYENAPSSNQQYWIVALLRELEKEGRVERDCDTKRWRLLS